MILYFKDRYSNRHEIARLQSTKEALNEIKNFLEKHNYKSYYQRALLTSDGFEILFDVGSYTEFFYLFKKEGWDDNWVKELYEGG